MGMAVPDVWVAVAAGDFGRTIPVGVTLREEFLRPECNNSSWATIVLRRSGEWAIESPGA